ncbi:MAG: helix-turn-helix transcriptional regulator [Zoogloeaceae bacterium]|jgi:transcriptional regulator with XRE-family HTH domain|nr:helix-turn-helix transcriptional regulator [Zoogloeaceae bacterium]
MSFPFLPVERALAQLGGSLKTARRRRNIKTELMAQRLGVSRKTLNRLEKGEAGVSIGTLATAIYALDPEKLTAFSTLFATDAIGQRVADRALPQRIRRMPKL